jgi:GrpB-like predicted nucleotidyltransferase (UPF0157 family)
VVRDPNDRDPDDTAAYDELQARLVVGGPQVLHGKIELCAYDPSWPTVYAQEAGRLQLALGDRVARVEHVGSTSVPGLAAKPIIDMVLEVADSAGEEAYVPDLEASGYVLTVREPEWFQHRLFKGPAANINLHVFSEACEETVRMVRFRDWLRTNPADRELYVTVKRELSRRDWKYVQQYADAKSGVVAEIMSRAMPPEPPR